MLWVLGLLFFASSALAADVLMWTPPTDGAEPNCYKIYRGRVSKAGVAEPISGSNVAPYDEVWEVPATATQFTLPTGKAGTYYLRMTSCNRDGVDFVESDFSEEISYRRRGRPPKGLRVTTQ